MISAFDMTQGQGVHTQWLKAFKFEDVNGNIRDLCIKMKPKMTRLDLAKAKIDKGAKTFGKDEHVLSVYKRYQLVAIMGTHSVVRADISKHGAIV